MMVSWAQNDDRKDPITNSQSNRQQPKYDTNVKMRENQ